jgi:VWFA-related protein
VGVFVGAAFKNGFKGPALIGALVSASLFFVAPRAAAQAPPGPIHPPPGTPAQPGPNKKPIRVKVDLVTAPVVVRDAQNQMVLDLDERDFKVFDNGAQQKIDHFDVGGDPLSIVFLVETSHRVAPMIPAIRKAAPVFSQVVMGETGEAAVVAFSGEVELKQKFTTDQDKVENTIKSLEDSGSQLRFTKQGRIDKSGPQTRLFDAMEQAIRMLEDRPAERRRVIVAITEATDVGSTVKLGSVLGEAQLDNVTIYTVGLSTAAAEFRSNPDDSGPISATPQGIPSGPPIPGEPQSPDMPTMTTMPTGANLNALAMWVVQHAENVTKGKSLEIAAAATGGEHLPTIRDKGIEKALDQIGGELHALYTLSYHPSAGMVVGFHTIKIDVDRAKTTVHTRPGYYLPPQDDDAGG